MRFWKRGGNSDLEARLRDARPEPGTEVTRAIVDRVRPSRRGFIGGLARLPLSLAVAMTMIVVVVAVALGGLSASRETADKALNMQNLAALKADVKVIQNSSTAAQYGVRVDVCVGGFLQLRLYKSEADRLIALHLAVLGPCNGNPPSSDGVRVTVCLGGYLEIRLSLLQATPLLVAHLVVSGPCPR